MFGRRSGPTSAKVRLLGGALTMVLGAALFALVLSTAHPVSSVVFWVAIAVGVGLVVGGLNWVVGVMFGVGDYGERPRSMPVARRLLLDAAGYLFSLALVATFAFFAISPEVNWGEGVAGALPRVAFGGFAAVFGGATVFALFSAARRALRGEPYDDKSPSRPPSEVG